MIGDTGAKAVVLTASQRRLLRRYEIPCLYSLQHVDNLPSIQRRGILSHADIGRIKHVDLSDEKVQRARSCLSIGGLDLHFYVPLFFRPLTPMEYVICVHENKRDEVAMLEIDTSVFALPGVWFTDGNARANATNFFDDLDDLDQLEWDILNTPNAFSRRYRRIKSAEVLVPHKVRWNFVKRVCVTRACSQSGRILVSHVCNDALFP